jgi:hypothetical protein
MFARSTLMLVTLLARGDVPAPHAPHVTGLLVVPNASAASSGAVALSLRDLLTSARGVAPALCALTADGVWTGRWGGGMWDAPVVSIGPEVRVDVRRALKAPLTADDTRALLDGLAADDACVRHLSATLIGRAEDKSMTAELIKRLGAPSAPERHGAALALGLMEAREAVDALVRALRDPSADVRANSAWALGRVDD